MDTEKKSPRKPRAKKVVKKVNTNTELKHKLIFVILIIGVIYCIVYQDIRQTTRATIKEKQNLESIVLQKKVVSPILKPTDKKFVGTLESYDTSCLSVGECSIVVSGIKVIETITGPQAPKEELGRLIGTKSIRDFKDHIGKKFEIYGEPQPNGNYSIYGSKNYYIKLMKY